MAALYNIYVYNNDGTQLLHTFDCDEPETAMHVYPDRLMLATSHIAYYPDGTIIGITTTQGSSTPTIEASDDSSTNYFYTDSDATVYLILEESALDDYSLSSLFIKQNGVLVPVQLVRRVPNNRGTITDLSGTRWYLNANITNTVPDGSDYQQLHFNFYGSATTSDISDNMCAPVIAGLCSPFSIWQELIVQLPSLLEGFNATNVNSTLDATSVPNNWETELSATECTFISDENEGHYFTSNGGFNIVDFPNILGTISFTYEEETYSLTFSELSDWLAEHLGIPLFDTGIIIYDSEAGFSFEGLRTWFITGGTDATNSDLIAWLQTNATQDYLSPITLCYTASTISLISFIIGSTTYQAEDGMTWDEWIASEYNTGNFTLSNNNVFSGALSVKYNGSNVPKTDTIIANATYTIDSSGGSSR